MGVVRRERTTRIFFAADLHGSEPTFRKFVAAAAFYGCDALVFGGDLMGKVLVPIVQTDGVYRAHFQDVDHEFAAEGLEAFTRRLELPGFYWAVLDPDQYLVARSDPLVRAALFHERATERLERWLQMAEERLSGTGVRMYLCGGNDDEPSVLETLERWDGTAVVPSEGRVVWLDAEHPMITVGLSTVTPWDTPREASEAEIATAIDAAVGDVPDLARCVFNLHCPPKDTVIDTCLKLERRPGEQLPQPVREAGRFVTTGGGSRAVREAIERYQPLVGLHGHIHESMGRVRLGRTPSFNPGSEYVQGTLNGWIVSLRGASLGAYQHTSG
jgi:Icc-related predicted phosphoesterase